MIAVKFCKYCLIEQPEDAFEVCKIAGSKVYRRLKCRQCKLSGSRLRKSSLRSWLDDYKNALVCSRCGFPDSRALQFHHKETHTKLGNVADMAGRGLSVATILREIEKCIVLCSNCHQIEHYEQRH